MNKTTGLLIIAVVVVGAVVIGLLAHGLSSGVPVEVAVVAKGPIHECIDERGKTRLPETFLITMPFNGRIESISLTEGDPVTAGQVVAKIVPVDLDLSVDEATAVVQRLKAALHKNADLSIEQTTLQQAKMFVESMENTVKSAEARVDSGAAKHEYALKHLARVEELFGEKTLTQDELDRAQLLEVETSVALEQDRLVFSSMQALEAATSLLPTMTGQFIARKSLSGAVLEKEEAEAVARLRQVEQDQKRGTMTSPISGVVLDRPVTNERYLPAGQTLMEIGRLEEMEVEVDVLSLDAVNVKVNNPVEIHGPVVGTRSDADRGSRPVHGTVKRIFPAGFTKISSLGVEQQRVKIIVDIDSNDLKWLLEERGLGVGYRVRVRIITAEKDEAVVVPRSTLFRNAQGRWQLYAVEGGRAQTRTVQLGMLNDELAEVIDGVDPGDEVILAPESNLSTGQLVSTGPGD
jgi:HlyD family secretion protein